MLRDPSLIPLSHQHQHGLALCVAMRRSLACDRSPENLARLAREVAAAYEAELANHFAIEEQVLFPLCPSLPMVAELLADHRALEGRVAQLRTTAAADLLVRFCGLLTSHIRREENELFQEIQRTLPREELDRAGADIGRRV
jgi:hemerythrin-like domain-containing protein